MIWTYGVGYAFDMLANNFEDTIIVTASGTEIDWHLPGLLSIIIGTFLLIVFFIAYFLKLKHHNEENPSRKLSAFTFTKPGEFLKDDEMLQQVSESVTKKIYTFYSGILPLLILFIILLPLNRYVYIVMIFMMLIVQNTIYYLDIRKLLSGDYKREQSK
ncbi:hypothetical protein ACS127_06030 [Amphibacillus sp. Q70]|uniref:hypothetical protein n=1 Tax=Amphibacillus sp. Q70 TaxID=3453416 RepID=UPI003F82F93F